MLTCRWMLKCRWMLTCRWMPQQGRHEQVWSEAAWRSAVGSAGASHRTFLISATMHDMHSRSGLVFVGLGFPLMYVLQALGGIFRICTEAIRAAESQSFTRKVMSGW